MLILQLKAIKELVGACPYLQMHQRQTMDLSSYCRPVHVSQKSKTDHLIVRVSDMDARRWLLILRIAEKLHSAEAEAMYGHCQSQFEQNQCIVDSWLYISSVESGFCNMFLATIICECSSSLFTFNSDWYFSARLFGNSIHQKRDWDCVDWKHRMRSIRHHFL